MREQWTASKTRPGVDGPTGESMNTTGEVRFEDRKQGHQHHGTPTVEGHGRKQPPLPSRSMLTIAIGNPNGYIDVRYRCSSGECWPALRASHEAKMLSHFAVTKIDIGVGSTAHWCTRIPESLVIFIHGFAGAAETTWHEFPSRFKNQPNFNNVDVLFYGYDSTRGRALPMSRLFLQFFNKFVDSPEKLANKHIYYLPRTPYKYAKIVIVAHSLGGALIRQFAIDLCNNNHIDRQRIKIILFSPAHKGSNALDLAGDLFHSRTSSSLTNFLASILFFRKPILQDLKTDSDFIGDLEKNTLELIGSGRDGCLIADSVFFDEYENIVETADFAKDPIFTTIPRQNHTNVCKPNEHYQEPLEYVSELV